MIGFSADATTGGGVRVFDKECFRRANAKPLVCIGDEEFSSLQVELRDPLMLQEVFSDSRFFIIFFPEDGDE